MPLIRHEVARNRRSEQNDSSINHQATKFGNCESAAFTRRLSLGRRSSITHRDVTILPGFVNGDNAMFRADDNGHFQRGSTQTGRRRSIRESGSALQARVRALRVKYAMSKQIRLSDIYCSPKYYAPLSTALYTRPLFLDYQELRRQMESCAGLREEAGIVYYL